MIKLKLEDKIYNVCGGRGQVVYVNSRETQDEFHDGNFDLDAVFKKGGTITIGDYQVEIITGIDRVQYEINPATLVVTLRAPSYVQTARFLEWATATINDNGGEHEYYDFV